VLYVDQLMEDSPLWASLRTSEARGFRLRPARGLQDRRLIHLPATADEYWARYSSKTRNTFKRKDKKLGAVELERITHADQVSEFLEAAHRISLKTWQTHRLGLRVSADERSRELFTFLADQQALRSYLLRREDQPIAFCIGTQFHRTFRYEEVGYDQEFAALSPGTVLLVRMLNDLFAEDAPEWFDFGEGDADYKRMFANEQRRSGGVWLVAPGWRRTMAVAGARLCHRLQSAARAGVTRLGLYRRLRQWHRQAPTEDAE
jgi:CelD/BcsL family acetyltransferase involved in cellulose biosynthesis